jgi:hypothetical protein
MRVVDLLLEEGIVMSAVALEGNFRLAPHQAQFHQEEYAHHFDCVFKKSENGSMFRYQTIFTVWTEKQRRVNCPGIGEVVCALRDDAAHIHQIRSDYRKWVQEFFKSRNPKGTDREFLQNIYIRQLENYKGLQFLFSAFAFDSLMKGVVEFDPPGGVNSKQARHRSDSACAFSCDTQVVQLEMPCLLTA